MTNLYSKLQIAEMNQIVISNKEQPIVGTWALATCHGILLYDVKNKIAYVGHAGSDYELILKEMLNLIHPIKKTYFEYLIIPGNCPNLDDEGRNKKDVMEGILNKMMMPNYYFIPFEIDYHDIITVNKETKSHEFAFDAHTGKFVTDEIIFDIDHLKESINNGRNK